MKSRWRGNLRTRIRVASGLVLFAFALTHFINIGFGLFSSELMAAGQALRQTVTRSLPGSVLLYAALFTHAGLALYRQGRRTTLRMPLWEAMQIVLGLLIPLLLTAHIVHTRVAHSLFDVNDSFKYLVALIFDTTDGWLQSLLMLIVWTHACIGLHFWLRAEGWWQRFLPVLAALAALVPAFALAGFLTEGRRMARVLADREGREQLYAATNWPDWDGFVTLMGIAWDARLVFVALVLVTAAIYAGRKLIRRNTVRIRYVDGPEISSPKGPTLLEMSRANGVPHTALCGGRGRCTTCRVIVEDGGATLPAPSEAEARSLRAVGAPAGSRLACQIRPSEPLTVYRVFQTDGKRARDHASHGQERRMAILFLDIRGFTARTTGQLPYDVVFLLNRFFDAIVPAITQSGGVVDKYLGGGLLALFEAPSEALSAQAALKATGSIGAALETFNETLAREGIPHIRIGVGLHLGDVVMGEIGAVGNAPRTIIGESVNAASRLEAKTKELGVEALISAPVLAGAGIDCAPLELLTLELRGVHAPVNALAVSRAAALETVLKPA